MGQEQQRAVLNAISQLKTLAAKEQVRKEILTKEISGLEEKLKGVRRDLELLVETDKDELARELIGIKSELEELLQTKQEEQALAEQQSQSALEEIRSLKKAARDLDAAGDRAIVSSAANADPFSSSATDVALSNVRDRAAELDARVKLETELHGERPALERLAEVEKVTSELRARDELARLKAERKKRAPTPSEPEADSKQEEPDEPTESAGKSKKTM